MVSLPSKPIRKAIRNPDRAITWLKNNIPKMVHVKTIRPMLPRVLVNYNNVQVARYRWGDRYVPGFDWTGDIPNFESGLCRAIREHVEPGNEVLIIGGGWGVSTVTAAREVGPNGRVQTYEAYLPIVPELKQTVELNQVSDIVEVQAGTVERAGILFGNEANNAPVIKASDLPNADVIVIDAEGAEKYILPGLTQDPNVLIVESHGKWGCHTEEVKRILKKIGYEINSTEIAEDWEPQRTHCEDNDVYVTTAVSNNLNKK